MNKFLTKEQKEEYFHNILQAAIVSNTPEELGVAVFRMFDDGDVVNKWHEYSQSLTKDEQEILDAKKQGWHICSVDGVYYYSENNRDTTGPWADNHDPWMHIVSARSINKLKEKGLYI